MNSAYVKIRIPYNGVYALGPGKADILEAIQQLGSISAAAKSMGMSYKRAWDLVDTMNRSFIEPLVATATGGNRGGAEVTEFGLQILNVYRQMQQKANAAINDELEGLHKLLKNQ